MKLKFTCLWVLSTLLISSHAYGQFFAIDTIKAISPYNPALRYIFPHLKSNTNQMAAQQINLIMTTDILNVEHDMDSAGDYKNAFVNVWGTADNTNPTVSDISFKVINNDSKFFCIGISAEGCGAYCEHWTRYYTRESRTGNNVGLKDIFTEGGLQSLSDSVRLMKNKRIRANINNMNLSLKKLVFAGKDDEESYKAAISLYGECIDSSNAIYDETNYSLSKSKLTIYLDPCLPHAMRAEDNMDYTFTFDIRRWRNYLSAYGKSILQE